MNHDEIERCDDEADPAPSGSEAGLQVEPQRCLDGFGIIGKNEYCGRTIPGLE